MLIEFEYDSQEKSNHIYTHPKSQEPNNVID